jgi:tubby-related protein 1
MYSYDDTIKSARGDRPSTPRFDSMSTVTTLNSAVQDFDDDDDLALPGSLNDNVLNQKFKRMQEAAQKSRPTARGGMGIVQSSRPLSARGSRPNSAATRTYLTGPPSTQSTNNPLNYSTSSTNMLQPTTPRTPRTQNTAYSNPSIPQDFELLEELDSIRNSRMVPPPSAAYDLEQKLRERGIVASFDPTASSSATGNGNHNIDSPSSPSMNNSSFRQAPRPKLDLSDRRRFVLSAPPVEYGFVRCYITRDRDRMMKMYPRYYLTHEDTKTFLLAGKKRKKNRTSNYALSLDDKDLKRGSDNFFGKLRANFVGTEFTIYDRGESAKNGDTASLARKQLGVISYETNILGTKGPRKLTIILPDCQSNLKPIEFPELPNKPTIMEKFKSGQTDKLRIFKNKSPVWNDKLKAYVLNFNGRVTKASVKNFQLTEVNDQNKVYLQFGKVDEDKFTLDYRHPITAIQAFSIALSAFDTKLACE